MKLKTAAEKIEVSSVSASFSFSILAEKRLDGITNDVDENSIGGPPRFNGKRQFFSFPQKSRIFVQQRREETKDVLFPGKRDNDNF